MKNILIILLTAIAIVLGAISIVQWRKFDEQQTQLTALRGEVEEQTRHIAGLESSQKLLEEQRDEAVVQASELAIRLQAAQRTAQEIAAASADPNTMPGTTDRKSGDKNPFGGFLAKMMEDPETRKVIQAQHRMMIDQLYAPLIRKMGLSAEEAEQFKTLLVDNMMKGAEKATSMFGGESVDRAEAMEEIASSQKSFEEQVRGFLGESRYAQYQEYQQTAGERAQLAQFQQQQAGGEHALTERQTDQLLAFMREEKQNVTEATGQPMPGTSQGKAEMEAMLSEEGTEKLLQSQAEVNQRVFDRAREVLTPEQLDSFGQFQTNQLQMMRMGMSMARKMMAPEKD